MENEYKEVCGGAFGIQSGPAPNLIKSHIRDRPQFIHEIFQDCASNFPNKCAVVCNGKEITYFELDQKSNRVAVLLSELGAEAEDPILVHASRSIELIIAFIGILKAGCAYVPINPMDPLDRRKFIISDCRPKVILSQVDLESSLSIPNCKVVQLDEILQSGSGEIDLTSRHAKLSTHNLAYIIYTSGTTGRPKGVMVEHASVVNFLNWRHKFYQTSSSDVFIFKAPVTFDLAIAEILMPLTVGALLVVAVQDRFQNVQYVGSLIANYGVTRLSLIPSMLEVMLPTWSQTCRTVKDLVCGGDVLPEKLVSDFFKQVDTGCRLHNLYGPTETTLIVSSYTFERPTSECAVSIGKPITGVEFQVLDENRKAVSIGEVGELYIGGIAVARGYLNQAILTSERFIKGIEGVDEDKKYYRTGDLVRKLVSGDYEFLGRLDDQIKLRGVRIELEEISAQLSLHPQVGRALVRATEGPGDEKKLVAYFVKKGKIQPSAAELRSFLNLKIPHYMMPSAFVPLDAFPLNSNGKIDKSQLPKNS
jgi:amino acid adenylation domain-containing protein